MSNLQCQSCDLYQCLLCSSLFSCSQCNNSAHYFLNQSTLLCELCTLEGCVICSSLYTCSQCDYDYGLDNSLCRRCNESCACNGYTPPWTGSSCSSECGDGWVVLEEECDDNNTEPDDGCSADCRVEPHFECVDEPSDCSFIGILSSTDLLAERDGCNNLTLSFTIQPAIPLLHQHDNLTALVSILHPNISLTAVSYSQGSFAISAAYEGDITEQQFHLLFDPSPFPSLNRSNLSLYEVRYQPIIPPVFYSPQECAITHSTRTYLQTVQIMSYVVLGGSVLAGCKVIGLELFGVLQLAYFDLITQDSLNFYSSTLADFHSFNGIRLDQ